VEALGLCLDQPNLVVQEAAASILATIADHRVLEPLMAALTGPDWIVRMHAAKALGRVGEPRAIPALLPLLQDNVKAVRVEVAGALAGIGEAAVPTLLDALRHVDWLVRLHAIEALGKRRAAAAVQPLLFVLFNDADTAVRTDAVRALGDIGDARAVEFLLGVLSERDLRPVAIEALGKIGDRRAVPALIDVVAGVSRPPDSRMVIGCGDGYDEEMLCTSAAVRALGQLTDPCCLPTLIAALQNTMVRSDAAAALTRFGQPAIAALLNVLKTEKDQNILYYAKEALTALGWRPNRI
jgi:HEAT repeat protein